jgi:hypothetical protein
MLLKCAKGIVAITFIVLLIMPRVATAQGLGSIGGTITDPSGAVVPSANVIATEVGTGLSRTATSSAQGNYLIPALRPAQYSLNVSVPGFRQFMRTGITLLADQAATVDVRLEVGATAQQMTVQAAATQVDTTTATIKQVVGESQMVELPLNGRNAGDLTMLVAGVSTAPTGANQGYQKSFLTSETITSNGSHNGNQILYLLDGAVYMDQYTDINQPFPFPDSLQEFSMQTSNYAAEFGQNAAGVVNVVSKSGTNSLHGDMFEFERNAVFNARNFFAANRDQLNRNQFGGTIGGPVTIPGLYTGRDRTFFFFGYQGTRLRDLQGGLSANVLTQANLNGDFSAMLNASNPANPLGKVVQIVNPVTGVPYSGNIVDPTTFDPASKALMKYLPAATSAIGTAFYTLPVVQGYNEYFSRIDHSFGTHDQLMGRYTYNKFFQDPTYSPTNILTYAMGAHIASQNYLLRETHVFRPNLLNNAYFTIARIKSQRGPMDGVPNVVDLGAQIYQPPPPKEMASISVSGFFSCCGSGYGFFARTTFDFADDLNWVHGRHNFAFGGTVYQSRNDLSVRYLGAGSFSFGGSNAGYYTNYAPASFLLGVMSAFSQGAQDAQDQRDTFPGVYAQDSFRASKRLSINYGVRYEPFTPWYETKARGEVFSPSAYYAGTTSKVYTNAPPGLFFWGDPGVPRKFTTGDYKEFMPRVGFAYDVFGDGKTSLRGGGGMFYATLLSASILNGLAFATPYSDRVAFTNPVGPFSNPYQGTTDPFPLPLVPTSGAAFPLPVVVYTFQPKLNAPLMYDWNLALEHQFPAGWFVRAAYVASHTSYLLETEDLNPAVYIPGSSLSATARRPFQNFSDIELYALDTNGNYNSLQLTVDKRFSSKLTFVTNYTYSKNLDDEPAGSEGATGVGSFSTVPWNLPNRHQMDYGPYLYDSTHHIAISYVYNLPKLAGANPWARGFLGNWEFSGIFTAQSGFPLTIVAGQDRSQTALNNDRAVQTGPAYGAGACKSAPCVNWLIPGSFQLPAIGTYGDTGKGMLRGPNSITWNMGLFKGFPITERWKLQFRAEFFNVFNRANFSNPGTSISGSGFGAIGSAADPRIGQLGLKLIF